MSQNNFASHPPQIVAYSGDTPESDLDRLAAFARAGDETAFRQIVEKYRRLVYSAALRRCGHRELAEEAMQNTFAVLARKSGHLLKHPTLSGWLHRTSMLEASTLLRGERTRRRKHSELMELETVQYSAGSSPSPASGPELDEALARLPARDRDVILMRFYEGMSFDEIGERLGKSNAACQKRSHRAVRKLSQLLAKPGSPAVGGAAVALAVSTQLADASPLSPAAAIADCAIARSSEVTISALALNSIHTMSYTKTITAAAITLALLIPVAIQSKESARLRRELTLVNNQLSGLEQQPRQPLASPTQAPAPKLTAIDPPDARSSELEPQAAVAAAPSPRSIVAKAFANLKREEIIYQRKYADGVPEPEDPGYADYVAEMDGFMRLLAKDMVLMAANESAVEIDEPLEKAEFLADVLRHAIELDEPTAAEIGAVLSQRLAEHGALIDEGKNRPEDPKLIPGWEAENERLFGSLWDEIHALLSPEQQQNFQFGFPRQSIVNRSVSIGFPGGYSF